VRAPLGIDEATIDVAQLERRGNFKTLLGEALNASLTHEPQVCLDHDFVPYDQTCVWLFNQAFWRYLRIWEKVSGKSYQRALPKGKSESHHEDFIAEAAEMFAGHVRELEREGSLAGNEELWFHEKAPGSGEFTAGLLDYLKEHYPSYYARMRVVLSDVSSQVLSLADAELRHRGHLPYRAGGPEIFLWDIRRSTEPVVQRHDGSHTRLEGKFLYFRHANFLDQLPTRLFAKSNGRFYEVMVRAVIAPARLAALEQQYNLRLDRLQAIIDGRLDLSQTEGDEQARLVNFWSAVYAAIKFEESYRPIEDFADYHPHGAVAASQLAELEDVRFVTSDWAIKIILEDMRLLHPEFGYACFTDIFLQRINEFRERWIELAKYDNGVWVGTNALLITELLARSGYEHSFYPVELTLGQPSPVYTLTVRKRQTQQFMLAPALIQQLTGIEQTALRELSLIGLSRRMRNNLRELPREMQRIRRDYDWSERLSDALDLSHLLREMYYRSPSAQMTANSPFVKLTALLAEVLSRNPQGPVVFHSDLAEDELRDLEEFLDHRPIEELPMDLLESVTPPDGTPSFRLRLPTLAQRLEEGEFVLLAEVDLPRSQSLEQLRRRIFQFQGHVDALSITSGRLADPRFLRSREFLDSPLLNSLQADRLVVTIEMRDRRAEELERDLREFQSRGVSNFFILTGDFERNSRWWLDSLHGIQIADRLRNQDGLSGSGSYMRSASLIVGAMAWSGIPDLRRRIERDVILKLRAGVDVLFTQPIYDLRVAAQAFEIIAEAGLERRVHIVPELFPIASLEQLRALGQAPGIMIPAEMTAAYRKIFANVGKFCEGGSEGEAQASQAQRFVAGVFDGVTPIPGYDDLFTAELAQRIFPGLARAVDEARRRAVRGQEATQALKAARDTVLYEVGYTLTQRAMAALCDQAAVSGFLIVARNGRELRRVCVEARRLRQKVSA